MASKNTIVMIRALSDDVRLRLFEILSEGDSSAARLMKLTDLSAEKFDDQISMLVESGLVTVSEDGDDRDYSVDPQQVAILTGFFELMLSKCSPPKCC